MADKMKKGFALRTFNDAGTEQLFEGGKVHEFEAGKHANFLAAGLIREPSSGDPKATGEAPTPPAA